MTKQSFFIWLAGIPGIASISLFVYPLVLDGQHLPVPIFVIGLASALQSALLLALAAWAGTKLAHQVGFSAPVLMAATDGSLNVNGLRSQMLPGVLGGLIGIAILVAFAHFSPEPLAQLQHRFSVPLIARVLYGGITEEILVRWGLMTVIAWLGWRILQDGTGPPSTLAIWLSILISSLAFGALHLPIVAALLGQLPTYLAAYIVIANAAFGIVAGFLFWRHGLETSILAHVIAHLGAFAFIR